MRWNLTINQPVTMDKVSHTFMSIVAPLLPVESTFESNRGTADAGTALESECIKQMYCGV